MNKKPYTGEAWERCPQMGGALCRKVCPTCKFQQQFTITERITGEVRIHWDCALAFQTQLLMEGNMLAHGVQHAVESMRNETIGAHRDLVSGTVKVAQQLLDGASQIKGHGHGGELAADGERNGARAALPKPAGAG